MKSLSREKKLPGLILMLSSRWFRTIFALGLLGPVTPGVILARSTSRPLQRLSLAPIDSLDSTTSGATWWVRRDAVDPVVQGLADETSERDQPQGWKVVAVPDNLVSAGVVPAGRTTIWYRRAFVLPETVEQGLSVRLGEISDRDRVYLNGELIGQTGDWESARPQAYDRVRLYTLPHRLLRPGQTNVLLVEVKGIVAFELGIYRDRTAIGDTVALYREFAEENMLQVNILMVYLAVGGYFFFLFVRQQRDRENLYFALFALALVGYHFLRTQYKYQFGIPFDILKKIQYLNLISMVPLFYFHVRHYFDDPWPESFLRIWDRFLLAVNFATIAAAGAIVFTNDVEFWEATVNQKIVQPLWLVYIAAGFAILIRMGLRRSSDALLMLAGISGVIVTGVLDIFTSRGVLNLPTLTTYSFIVFVLSLALILANRFVRVHIQVGKLNTELTHTNTAYSRFVPREFLGFLGRTSIIDVQIGDQVRREMTLLFSDIRSFTSLSETMSPEENFDFLNSYLKHMTPLVQKNNGFIDKYIGDSIMALFPDSPEDALRAAIDMQRDVNAYNDLRVSKGFKAIEVGIGIHTGMLMLGTIGAAERMEGTVISDTVNLASRLEGITKMFGASIAISGASLRRIPNFETRYNLRLLGNLQVKGKLQSVEVFEVFDGAIDSIFQVKLATSAAFGAGYERYRHRDFTGAVTMFTDVLKKFPGDKAAKLYLERSRDLLRTGIPDNWEAIEKLESK